MKSLRKFLKDLKKTYIWKFFIQYFFYPFYNFFWQFFLNFEAKILCILWLIKKRDFINLSKKNEIVITNNETFKDLSKKISNETNLLIENSKKKILSAEYKKKLTDEIDPYSSDTEIPYRTGLYDDLSDNLKSEIVKFASSEMMISTNIWEFFQYLLEFKFLIIFLGKMQIFVVPCIGIEILLDLKI